MNFTEAYKSLNPKQKEAIDIIDGPLMVVAGPGTGKTQLLATRVANILKHDSTLLPTNILCLTFSESGQVAMQRRLIELMGETGAHVAVHTFHSFGSEIINRYPEYFYKGANYSPADELTTHEIIIGILEDLPHKNPLATKNQDEFVYIRAIKDRIEDFKKNALEPSELRELCLDGLKFVDFIEKPLIELFDVASFSKKDDINRAVKVYEIAQTFTQAPLKIPTFKPLCEIFVKGFGQAVESAIIVGKPKPINDWKSDWFKRDEHKHGICKQREILQKLLALSEVYELYQQELNKRKLYDFADMIMRVVHALESRPDLAYELQEQYQYFLVDEFQDTNAGQLRLLTALASHPVNEGRPNVMVVGDDDQAIYAFQGAELSNILGFKDAYQNVTTLLLNQNYRSSQKILDFSHSIISQGIDRLEARMPDLNKELTASGKLSTTKLTRQLFNFKAHEYEWVASEIKNLINSGHEPKEIAIICAEHKYLESLLPYLFEHSIPVAYERRQNALKQPQILELITLTKLIDCLSRQSLEAANGLLPEVLSADYWQVPAMDIWKLSLASTQAYKKEHREVYWLELMLSKKFGQHLKNIAEFLIETSKFSKTHSLEETLDKIIGNESSVFINNTNEESDKVATATTTAFASPFKDYYFANELLAEHPEKFISLLSSLAAIRNQLRKWRADTKLSISDFVYFVDLCNEAKVVINVSGLQGVADNAVRLLSAHGSKGLEFKTVFILSAVSKVWDKKPMGHLLTLPPNLLTIARKDNADDRLRLFYVALTRAKSNLYITGFLADDDGKDVTPFGALEDSETVKILASPVAPVIMPDTSDSLLGRVERQWYDRHYQMPAHDMRQLLDERLKNYKLSVTHLNNFIDIVNSGPLNFLLGNLLQFPSAMQPSAAYGSAMHSALDYIHQSFNKNSKLPSRQDIYNFFISTLKTKRLNDKDEAIYLQKGQESLKQFLLQSQNNINTNQQTELNFNLQGATIGPALLTGRLDVLEINKLSAKVIDYKTGKHLISWDPRGKNVYERIKQHKYRQQLLFYKLLVDKSRSWGDKGIKLETAELVFVEPAKDGQITRLNLDFNNQDELDRLEKLIVAIWQKIMNLDFPDTSQFEQSEKGITDFEDWLIKNS